MNAPLPLPDGLQRRLYAIVSTPILRRAPRLCERIEELVRDAAARRGDVARPARNLADRHQPVILADGAPGITYCVWCGNRRPWPCREAVLAAEILHAIGHPVPYKLPRRGHPAYSPDPAPELEGATGPGNSYNPAPDWIGAAP